MSEKWPAMLHQVEGDFGIICDGQRSIDAWAEEYLDSGQALVDWLERMAVMRQQLLEWTDLHMLL